MFRIGIDVGSTYTKYCVMQDGEITELFSEQTPVRQKEYFEEKLRFLTGKYPGSQIVSCGYGRLNVPGTEQINELTALARGVFFSAGTDGTVLDIGGQDTKIIFQEKGQLKDFFINDKCAAGSGMFLSSVIQMLGLSFEELEFSDESVFLNDSDPGKGISLSSVCAVFAQSEIVELIAKNYAEQEIINAVVRQILMKARALLVKLEPESIMLSGGMSQIRGIEKLAGSVLGVSCSTGMHGAYLAAIGCALK